MDPVFTIYLIEDTLGHLVWSVGRDFVAPLDSLENFCALLSIQNSGPLRYGYLLVRVRSDHQRVHRGCSLSDGVEVARVAQVVAPVNKTSIRLVLTGNFLKRFEVFLEACL